jgi:two-component system cell cycle response regulator
MPEIDGYGFLIATKLDPALREIPFAIISSTVWRDTDPGIAISMGADKFILRPIEPEELVDQIEACLATSSKGKNHGHDSGSR